MIITPIFVAFQIVKKMFVVKLRKEILNSFQCPLDMTARPKNTIALRTFMKLTVIFINVIRYQTADSSRISLDNRDITMNASYKRLDVRRTDSNFSDDLIKLRLKVV